MEAKNNMSDSQSAEQKPQLSPQGTPGAAPAKGSETPTGEPEAPKYTETQWREKQASIRREIQPLKDRIAEIESERNALISKLEVMETDGNSLKQTLAEMQTEIDARFPDEVKGVISEYRKFQDDKNKWYSEKKQEFAKAELKVKEYNDWKLNQEADRISRKYGIDTDLLKGFKTPDEMLRYVDANFDPAKLKPESAPVSAPATVAEEPKLEKPVSPVVNAGGVSDNEFIAQYARGDSNDHARYREIVNKRT
jgi:predicted  nucleic acid-binding Zn-ribbon protein